MYKSQLNSIKDVKRWLFENEMKNVDLIPHLKKLNPDKKIQRAHISMALKGKYPNIYNQIIDIINELQN